METFLNVSQAKWGRGAGTRRRRHSRLLRQPQQHLPAEALSSRSLRLMEHWNTHRNRLNPPQSSAADNHRAQVMAVAACKLRSADAAIERTDTNSFMLLNSYPFVCCCLRRLRALLQAIKRWEAADCRIQITLRWCVFTMAYLNCRTITRMTDGCVPAFRS